MITVPNRNLHKIHIINQSNNAFITYLNLREQYLITMVFPYTHLQKKTACRLTSLAHVGSKEFQTQWISHESLICNNYIQKPIIRVARYALSYIIFTLVFKKRIQLSEYYLSINRFREELIVEHGDRTTTFVLFDRDVKRLHTPQLKK